MTRYSPDRPDESGDRHHQGEELVPEHPFEAVVVEVRSIPTKNFSVTR